MGRRPKLKSDEFSVTFLPLYLSRYQGVNTFSQQKKCHTFSELYPLESLSALARVFGLHRLGCTTYLKTATSRILAPARHSQADG